MNRSVSRRITGTIGATGVVVLVLVGAGYLRMDANGERIDQRNLRDLGRTARTIEGTLNNLESVLQNLESGFENLDPEERRDTAESKAALIPHFVFDDLGPVAASSCTRTPSRVAARVSAEGYLDLCYPLGDDAAEDDTADATPDEHPDTVRAIRARFDLAGLEPYLVSDYMDAVFLADASGTVILWAPDESGIRVHELAGLDTARLGSGSDAAGLGTSAILRATIAGDDHYFYLLPLGIELARPGSRADRPDRIRWILGGVTTVADHRQESLSIDSEVALFLGFIAFLGFLAVPVVRIYTMGPRERFRVGNLLYLVFALVLAAGLIGLGIADRAYYAQLEHGVNADLDATADSVAKHLDLELTYALDLLDDYSDDLTQRLRAVVNRAADDTLAPAAAVDPAHLALFDTARNQALDPIRMRARIDTATLDPEHGPTTVYPELHMVVWLDSIGQQVAKWTTRDHNTPRIDVPDREYHRIIRERRAWPRAFHTDSASACPDDARAAADTARLTYFLQSIRSLNTGEKVAAISKRFPSRVQAGDGAHPWGVVMMITELASLRHTVLPAGVQIAVVDSAAVTQFHTRPERELDENFAEETDAPDLVRSALRARACRELDVKYGGRGTRLVIRPLRGRPLFLMAFMDRALLDTVRFESWFVAAAVFGGLALLVFAIIAVHDRIGHARLGWIWPDVERPGKYAMLVVVAFPFTIALAFHVLWPSAFPASPASALLPVLFLALEFVVLSTSGGARRESAAWSPRDQRERQARRPPGQDWRGRLRRWFTGVARGLRRKEGVDARGVARSSRFGWGLFFVAATVLVGFAGGAGGSWRVWLLEAGSTVVAGVLAFVWCARPWFRPAVDDIPRSHPTRLWYTVAMTAALLVVGVLPGYLAYQVAFHGRSASLVEHHQLEVDRALKARAARLDSTIRERLPGVHLDTVYRSAFRPSFDLAFRRFVVDTAAVPSLESTNAAGPARDIDWPRTLHRLLADRPPFLTDASVRVRQLTQRRDGRVSTRDHDQLRLRMSNDSMLVSKLPPAAGARWWLLGLLGAVAVVALAVYEISRRVLFVHVEHAEPLSLDDALPDEAGDWRPTIFVGTRSVSRRSISNRCEVQFIDLMALRTAASGAMKPVRVEEGKKAVCLDYFDYRITEPDWNRRLLAFLERHTYSDKGPPFILITSRDPEALLLTGERGSTAAPERPESGAGASSVHAGRGLPLDERRRWDRLLGKFSKVIVTDSVRPDRFQREVDDALAGKTEDERNARRVADTLVRECGHSERLWDIGRQILRRHDWAALEPHEVVKLIRESAETYYGARWAILTEAERLVAAQLASGAVVNPRSRQAVTRLFARGFVVRDPEPRLDNESFKQFVQDQVPADRLTAIERADAPSGWSLVRGPLILGWIGVALFLFWTERDVLSSTIAFLGTAGVGLASIIKVLTLFERTSRTPESESQS